jgi:hypothetical protein
MLKVLAATMLLASALAGAQQPDCNLAERSYDNPFSDSHGFTLRRYQWHGAYATAGALVGETVHRTTRLPRWASFLIAGTTIKVVPHVRGVLAHRYPFNARDWAFDAFIGAAPLIAWAGWTGGNWRTRTLGALSLTTGYFALACFASP